MDHLSVLEASTLVSFGILYARSKAELSISLVSLNGQAYNQICLLLLDIIVFIVLLLSGPLTVCLQLTSLLLLLLIFILLRFF